MKINCPKCKTEMQIAEDKIPKDKEKAMVKCVGCQQILTFVVPAHLRQQAKPEEKTEIDFPKSSASKILTAKLIDETGKIYPLQIGKNSLGRKASITLEDSYASREHCLIEVMNNADGFAYVLSDSQSTNGTFHNGNKLTQYDKIYLQHEDKIKIGHTYLVFEV